MTTTASTVYQVTGMSCGHCENAIREEVGAVEGVTGVEVSSATGVLRVSHGAPADAAAFDAAILAAVDEAGYAATPA